MSFDETMLQFDSMNNLNIGDYIMIKNYPCKIVSKSCSKTGKHGSSKAHIVGKDVFTDKKYEEIFGSSDKVQVPILVKASHVVQFVEDDSNEPNSSNVYIMDGLESRSEPVQINKLNETDVDILKTINELLNSDIECIITIIRGMNKERIVQCTQSKN
jgi:translation initiation factor 5A